MSEPIGFGPKEWSATLDIESFGVNWREFADQHIEKPVEMRFMHQQWWIPNITVMGAGFLITEMDLDDHDIERDQSSLSIQIMNDNLITWTGTVRDAHLIYGWKHWAARPVYWLWQRWQGLRSKVKQVWRKL